jgi:hypothetical protein
MRHMKAILIAVGVVLLGLGVAFVYLFFEINRQVDLCDDSTSGRYIQDADKRQEVCSEWR